MKASEMTNEELAECIESACLAPAKYVREDKLNFHREAIREAAERLRKFDITIVAQKAKGAAEGYAHGCEETREKQSQVGNAEKMRDALEKIASMGEQIEHQLGSSEETVYAFRYERCLAHNISECARDALSATPRNCDLFATPKEAGEAFISQACENPCGNCTVSDEYHNPLIHECGIEWLFARRKEKRNEGE